MQIINILRYLELPINSDIREFYKAWDFANVTFMPNLFAVFLTDYENFSEK